jgi:hypothetical protein
MSPSFMKFLVTACFLCTVDLAVSTAQEPSVPPSGDQRPQLKDCRVAPKGQGEIDQGEDSAEHGTAVLQRCKGVLEPPPTGDSEMVAPAPHVGTTPVIPPDSVPEQPPVPDRP